MEERKQIIVNVQTSRVVAEQIEGLKLDGLQVESVQNVEADSARFGIAEVAVVVGIVQGVFAIVKLALEIKKLMAEEKDQEAQLSAPGAAGYIMIKSSISDEEVERRVKDHFGG